MSIDNNLIETCYRKSLGLLEKNSTRYGVLASSPSPSPRARARKYLSVFGRDASICSLGLLAADAKRYARIARQTLTTLARFQAGNGQVPNCVQPERKYVNFWVMGSIDATLWWLILLKYYERLTDDIKLGTRLKKQATKAIIWLSCQEHPLDGLLLQNEASDMADIMPRSGHVLYSNALWHEVKKLYGLADIERTEDNFRRVFSGLDLSALKVTSLDKYGKRKKTDNGHCYSFVNYLFHGEDVDVLGNALAVIFSASGRSERKKIVGSIAKRKKENDLPIPSLFNPITRRSPLWRPYMANYNQNFPYQYQNGGIWPFISSFWAMALYKSGYKEKAWQELERVARANSINNWQFNEWLHGKTGKPLGMPGQSWNAGAFLLAYHYLQGGVDL